MENNLITDYFKNENKNYYFIANNEDNITYLDNKIFDKNDIIIVFNKSFFENHKSFKNAYAIYHFYRMNNKSFHGIEILDKCKCSKKILFGYKDDTLLTKYKNKNISFYYDFKNMKKEYNYEKLNKTPQSGSMAFEYLKIHNYIKQKKTNIYLIGFTSIYPNKLWLGHSKELEDSYFNIQKEKYNFNIQYIIKQK